MELILADNIRRIYHEIPHDLDNGILYRYSFNDLRSEPLKHNVNYEVKGPLFLIKGIYSYERWNGVDTRQLKYEPFYGVNEYNEYALLGLKTIDINLLHYRIDLYSYKDNTFKESYICANWETFNKNKGDNEYKSPNGIYFCGLASLDNLTLFKKIMKLNEIQKNSTSASYLVLATNEKQKILQLSLNIV